HAKRSNDAGIGSVGSSPALQYFDYGRRLADSQFGDCFAKSGTARHAGAIAECSAIHIWGQFAENHSAILGKCEKASPACLKADGGQLGPAAIERDLLLLLRF